MESEKKFTPITIALKQNPRCELCNKWVGHDRYVQTVHQDRHEDGTWEKLKLSCPFCNIDLENIRALNMHLAVNRVCKRDFVVVWQVPAFIVRYLQLHFFN